MNATYLIGDTFDRMAELPDGSVDLVLTSPPFLALRSYLPDDHPNKAKEIGSEPTPAEFIDTLLRLTAEWGRVLAPHGSIAIELGDSFAGSGGAGGDYGADGLRAGQPKADGSGRRGRNRVTLADGRTIQGNGASNGQPRTGEAWPLDKSLCGIPTLYAWSLAYGRNLLTGEPSPAGQWRIRNVVAWVRPNPPVGALGDKFRPATSYMTIATRARDRWFDLDDVRSGTQTKAGGGTSLYKRTPGDDRAERLGQAENTGSHPAGAPPLDWWEIPTEPYKGAHYATWPRRLCERPIRAMCPSEVCRVCGEPRRRIVGPAEYVTSSNAKQARDTVTLAMRDGEQVDPHARQWASATGGSTGDLVRSAPTLGFTDCGHGDYRRGVVLDPFAGSGTTLAVATGLGRDAIGIDLDERNADLALDRVGPMLLDVVRPGEAA